MANTASLSQLIDRIRSQADIEDDDNITDDTLRYWINTSLSELHDLLVNTFEDYFLSTSTTALISGTNEYTLPTDFYKLKHVYYVDGTDHYKLRKFSLEDRDVFHNITGYSGSAADAGMRYRILGNNIRLEPAPTTTNNMIIWYVPQFDTLDTPSDTVHLAVPIMWEDYVIVDVVARCMEKQEDDPSVYYKRKAEIIQRIKNSAKNRDETEIDYVSDVHKRFFADDLELYWYD